MSRDEMAKLWISRINDYRASREPVAAWCQRHQVTPRQLYCWMRKLKRADQQTPSTSGPQWLSLSLEPIMSEKAPPILVRFGTIAIEVRAGFEAAVFADVVRALKTLC